MTSLRNRIKENIFFPLIFLSGAAGLIYEVVWQRYLGILLGAQARATAIVLAVFLGGISIGYQAFGQWTKKTKKNLYTAFATVEILLALWAMMFPVFFRFSMFLAAKMYSWWGTTTLATDILLSIALLGLPTFLMGGTLPLLTQAESETQKDISRTHSKIYGYNTAGAFLGCLFCGYFLIPSFGLDVTLSLSAGVNTIVGSLFYFFYGRNRKPAPKNFANELPAVVVDKRNYGHSWLAILAIGFLSGFVLISLEAILIRLTGLSSGSSNYNFALIVAIFVLCLALGSLSLTSIEKTRETHLFRNQLLLTIFFIFLYISGDTWSYLVHVLRIMFRDIPEAFYPYQTAQGLLFLSILIIPLGTAGKTLPLCFHLLKDRRDQLGLRVGQLYGTNTAGCVMGALFGGYLLFNIWDLDQLFKMCIFLTCLGTGCASYLLIKNGLWDKMTAQVGALVIVALMVVTYQLPRYHTDRWEQPFRKSQPFEGSFKGPDAFGKELGATTKFIYWKDGPNTSVGIGMSEYQGHEHSRSIFVNGKSDGNTYGDFFTTSMLAHISGLLSPKTSHVCVVGLGTGVTIGYLAENPDVDSIDVAEISNFSISSASYFDKYDHHVSTQSKVHFHEMDAFRYIEGTPSHFDVIVSEPSNPWVAGVENLYSFEFYDMAARKLDQDGMFVQWIHTYSFNDDLFRMVLATMSSKFPYVSVFQLRGGDLALIGRLKPLTKDNLLLAARKIGNSYFQTGLAELGISKLETVLGLEVIPNSLIASLAEGSQIHQLVSPKLSNLAAKAFFAGTWSKIDTLRRDSTNYLPSLNDSLLAIYTGKPITDKRVAQEIKSVYCDGILTKVNYLCGEALVLMRYLDPSYSPTVDYSNMPDAETSRRLASYGEPSSKEPSFVEVGRLFNMFDAYRKNASPIFRLSKDQVMSRIETCVRSKKAEPEVHGHCLLEKVVVLDSIEGQTDEWRDAAREFLAWFPQAKTSFVGYPKFKEAYDIISSMKRYQRLE